MPWVNEVPAIVQGWYLGSEAGTALASVLVGDVNPSGKLPVTLRNDGKTIPLFTATTIRTETSM